MDNSDIAITLVLISAFMRASVIMGIIWLLLGLWLLSWVVH